jgi:hypothetical protein
MTLSIILLFAAVAPIFVLVSLLVYRAARSRTKRGGYKKRFAKNLGSLGWDQEILNSLSTWSNEDLKARLIGKGVSRDAVVELERSMSHERFRAMLIESNAQYDTASLRVKKR